MTETPSPPLPDPRRERFDATADPCAGPPLSIGDCAVLACLWELAAAKPGNVYRGADFEDVTFADFAVSATAIRQAMDDAAEIGVGPAVLAAVRATQAAVRSNTNLGMTLLMAPLAATPLPLVANLPRTLAALTVADASAAFEAIRTARPGGLGSVAQHDVEATEEATVSLRDAMALAADRDLVARQYACDYLDVWEVAEAILRGARRWSLEDAIVRAYVELMARRPDTLIARKCGLHVAQEASVRAAAALDSGEPGEGLYMGALSELDFWLRSDGHRRNPGATADVVAAALFALLRERRIAWPVAFYR
ncbi:MAG: triphosphoribosyl-dephospho-CoA synthase [Planctomycetales bacterium]|nr:triphosphoribosyl-dephospho-CoA synthase [Planctomycetales bacterium]